MQLIDITYMILCNIISAAKHSFAENPVPKTSPQLQPSSPCVTPPPPRSGGGETDLELSADDAAGLSEEQRRGRVEDELARHARSEHGAVLGAVEEQGDVHAGRLQSELGPPALPGHGAGGRVIRRSTETTPGGRIEVIWFAGVILLTTH